jgi:t-SNARE complex subunit (syntaxin)
MIGALMIVDEEAAANRLLTALDENDGNTVATAAALEVNHSTLKRWLRKLDSRQWDVKTQAAKMRDTARRVKRRNGVRR